MANTFLTISVVAFVLAAGLLIGTIVLFFMLDVRGAYAELNGNTDKKWVTSGKNKSKDKKKKESVEKEHLTEEKTVDLKIDGDGEAYTTSEDGQIVTQSLVGVYEPGTEIMTEKIDDSVTEAETWMMENEEESTVVDSVPFANDFIITKREVYTCSDEIIK